LIVAALFVLWAPSFATAGTIRTDRMDSLYTTLAQEPRYRSVGEVDWTEGNYSYGASGVVIADNWVLTAGHVVGGTDNAGGGIRNMTFRVGSRTYTAAEWIPHPEWTSSAGSLDTGVDLGLVRLTRSVLVDAATLYEGRSERNLIGTIVGYGSTGTGSSGVDESLPSIRRAGNNVLDSVRGDIIEVDFDNPTRRNDSTFGSSTPLDLEYLPAPGDSGGGLFIDVDGMTELAGITSYTSATDFVIDSDYGDLAGFVRVSSYLDWIESIVGDLNALFGDFNSDKYLTADDIDILTREIGFNTTDTQFDLNGDGVVNLDDRVFWVEDVFHTHLGDLNLDGRVDDVDLNLMNNTLFNYGTEWTTGDFNGDGNTDVSDWNLWNDNRGLIGAAAVPEPACGVLLSVLAMAVIGRSRGRWQRCP
jgi:hypothetical protein